jgi:hypothetical protein
VVIHLGPNSLDLIKKRLPKLAEKLIKTEEKVVKSALGDLKPAELQQIGATMSGGHDKVLIKPVDDALDKLIEKVLEDATSEEG